MRVQVYEQLMAMQRSRRDVLKGAAGAAALAASSSVLTSTPSFAEDSVVPQIMKIPGAGNGSPTDADWQKVGALCLGPTKANVKPGEFAGVKFSFMGLNNQNLHNFLFRGFLKPWEAYTGAKIKWIDLAQADYNARLQQSIATGTADFDILEMGAPFEGDMGGQGPALGDARLGEDADRFRRLRQLPQAAGRHVERQDPPRHHRQRLPHHQLSAPTSSPIPISPNNGRTGRTRRGSRRGARRRPGSRCRQVTKFLKGKKVKGKEVYGFLDQPKPWGGFQFYFTGSRATAYAKYPGEKNWLFDENMKPLVNNPGLGARHPGRDRRPALRAGRPDQRRSQHDRVPAVPRRAPVRCWNGGATSARMAKTSDTSTIGEVLNFDILPGSDDVYNFREGRMGEARERPEPSRRTWPISAGASM